MRSHLLNGIPEMGEFPLEDIGQKGGVCRSKARQVLSKRGQAGIVLEGLPFITSGYDDAMRKQEELY